jgi:histone-lysine N-methyltransferase SETMAR
MFRTQKSSSKVLMSVFWDKDKIYLVDYLEKGATITAKYYVAQTEARTGFQTSRQSFERNLLSSRQCCSSQGGHYAPEIGKYSLEVQKHPTYSPNLAPSDYYLFPNLKKHLRGRKFSSIEEATLAADGWFAAQPKEFFFNELKKLEQ